MKELYSSERNVQILISLLKANNIKKIVASPGSTNIPLVISLQNDGGFDIYSCVDERSAAYMAVGLSAESGEPVVLTCTGATASRNYFSGLTEAFYRRLPILAVTSTRPLSCIGNHVAQVIDRTAVPNDIVKLSVFAPLIRCHDDEWDCNLKLNRAMAALKKNGGGPVHINLETESSFDFSVRELKSIRSIKFIQRYSDGFPTIPSGRVAIFVGSHPAFTKEETEAIDVFCEKYNGAVYCDHTSNYRGKYRVLAAILGGQDQYLSPACNIDLIIYIGEIIGAYEIVSMMPKAKAFWRVSEDGEFRDSSRTLSEVFHMSELDFFSKYNSMPSIKSDISLFNDCQKDYNHLYSSIPENLPFSNIWMAYEMAPMIPKDSVMHYAILNSLRSWNFFETPETVRGYCNVGGFGIDGNMSALLGASLCNKEKLYFGVVGDLSFFYDMNCLGNRHIKNNIRILMINNGKAMEFRNYTHPVSKYDNSMVDLYISAGGHYGHQSVNLVKHYAEDLGFEYITASSKNEFKKNMEIFLSPKMGSRPIIFEVFTQQDDENMALHIIRNLDKSADKIAINIAKDVITKVAGKEVFQTVKKIIRNR